MTWLKVDDSFWSHPKTMMLSADAIALWVRAGSWSCQQLTDGLISDRSLPLFGAPASAVDELVGVGFWNEVDGGYEFHDWDDYQEKSETVKDRRAKARERMRAVRANRERTMHERSVEQNAKFAGSSLNPDPTRPDPTRPSSSNEEEKRPPRKRGVRLSPEWLPSEASRAKARTDAPDVDHRAEHAVFVDYWIAQPGQKGVKADWEATWRNWMRRKQDDLRSRTTQKPTAAQRNMQTVDFFREQETDTKEIQS